MLNARIVSKQSTKFDLKIYKINNFVGINKK